jgi:hypothetical protein
MADSGFDNQNESRLLFPVRENGRQDEKPENFLKSKCVTLA